MTTSISPASPTSSGILARRPWLLVVFAFLLLLAGWSTLIYVALKFAPQQVESSHP